MTTNQKLYFRWLRAFAILFVALTGFLVICTNYGEEQKVEYSDINQ